MNYEARKHIVECYFGKFWHVEKISQSLLKKYDLVIPEDDIKAFVDRVDAFIESAK